MSWAVTVPMRFRSGPSPLLRPVYVREIEQLGAVASERAKQPGRDIGR
jgi:hypothetical protein